MEKHWVTQMVLRTGRQKALPMESFKVGLGLQMAIHWDWHNLFPLRHKDSGAMYTIEAEECNGSDV